MLIKTRIVLSLAIVLGTATAAMAAPKQPVHHQRTAGEHQLSGASVYGHANSANTGAAALPPEVVKALKRQAAGDPRCIGGNCDANYISNY